MVYTFEQTSVGLIYMLYNYLLVAQISKDITGLRSKDGINFEGKNERLQRHPAEKNHKIS